MMTPFTKGFRRRNKEKLMNSALDMLSLRFLGRASWSHPEVYKNLKFKEKVQAGSMCWKEKVCIGASLKSFSTAA